VLSLTDSDSDPLPEPLAAVAEAFGAPGLILRDHGPHHWKCVALTGLAIARKEPAIDLQLVYVFAQLHDSQRMNEYSDPEHGPRAAEVAAKATAELGIPGFEAGGERTNKLIAAIRDHTTARSSEDLTIGACWDADRFNLWRVGTVPDVAFMSTPAAREHFGELSQRARAAIARPPLTWHEVDQLVGARAS
jgi:uncharacterized protein